MLGIRLHRESAIRRGSPVSSSYPYGISKLQGEEARDADGRLRTSRSLPLRKGTVSGYSPRMRFDLLVNTMFKCAMQEGVIHVTDPAIWRPFLAIEDATMAYTRAIEANESLSGIFNIASGNHTVGEVADLVKLTVEEELGKKIAVDIKHIKDMRNYKVSIERANTVLSFHPHQSVKSIVRNLIANLDKCGDWTIRNTTTFGSSRSLKRTVSLPLRCLLSPRLVDEGRSPRREWAARQRRVRGLRARR